MKPLLFLSIFVAAFGTAQLASAYEIGTLQIGGTGCEVPTGAHELIPVAGTDLEFAVPVMMRVSKSTTPMIERKACLMSLVVDLEANEKLVIHEVSQKVRLIAGQGTKASTQLEVTLVGEKGQIMTAEVAGTNRIARKGVTLQPANQPIAASECGKDVIVRANSSALINGTNSGRVSTQPLYINMQVVRCH